MTGQTLKEKAYRTIIQKIMSCEYMPGEFVNEKKIIEEINVSRTPIREAIIQLEQEGLVSILPKRGVLICPITIQDVMEAFQVRELIEPYALRVFGHLLDKEAFRGFYSQFSDPALRSDHEKVNALDDEMHMTVVKACSNHYFMDIINAIRIQNHRVRILSNRETVRFLKTIDDHLGIIDAILSGNYDRAAELMATHLVGAREATINSLTSMKI